MPPNLEKLRALAECQFTDGRVGFLGFLLKYRK